MRHFILLSWVLSQLVWIFMLSWRISVSSKPVFPWLPRLTPSHAHPTSSLRPVASHSRLDGMPHDLTPDIISCWPQANETSMYDGVWRQTWGDAQQTRGDAQLRRGIHCSLQSEGQCGGACDLETTTGYHDIQPVVNTLKWVDSQPVFPKGI